MTKTLTNFQLNALHVDNGTTIVLPGMNDEHRKWIIGILVETLEFKGTIRQIRELVNDPKWDDKV